MNKRNLEQIRKKHKLKLILLHGSQVTGKLHTQSDVDIGIIREDSKKEINLLGLLYELSRHFGTDKVDISDLTHANPLLIFTATQQAVLLAGNPKDLKNLQLKAFKLYCDYLPYLKKEHEFVQQSLKKIQHDST